MRVELEQSTQPRLLRKPALVEVTATSPNKAKKKTKTPKGSRFVGPTQFDEDQKSRIRTALEQKKVGDELGRQIFVGALEYQISAFADRLGHRRAPEPRRGPGPDTRRPSADVHKTLQAIAGQALGLSRLLQELPESARERVTQTLAAQDGLGRDYDERYLRALGCEIDRLEQACAAAADADPEPPVQPEADAGSSAEFVAKLAGIFSECFEMEPTADPDGSFRISLEVVGEVTGLLIRQDPAFLAQVLAGQAANRGAR